MPAKTADGAARETGSHHQTAAAIKIAAPLLAVRSAQQASQASRWRWTHPARLSGYAAHLFWQSCHSPRQACLAPNY